MNSLQVELQCVCVCYLLESLVELALLEELQDVGLLRLVVEVRCGDGRAGRRPHRLHDAGGDHRLLLLHRQAHLPFDNPLHVAKNRLLQAEEEGEEEGSQLLCCTVYLSLGRIPSFSRFYSVY